MKNKLIKYIVVGWIITLPSTSCTDFLEEQNPNEISTETYWNTLKDLDNGLIAVYNAFKHSSILSIPPEYNRSDMTWPGFGRPNTTDPYYLQIFNEAANAPNQKWEALYRGIFRSNQVILATDNLMGTFRNPEQEERALEIMAQARFFRGLFYFYLHNSFNNGSVVIYDFVPKDEEDFYQPLSSAEDVRAFYLADLKFAHENLPPVWSNNANKGRVTAGAAAAVLGKSYLYDENYEKASEYFKDVIENPGYGYALTESIGDNFTTRREHNEESILEINYSLNFRSEVSIWAEEQVSNTLNYVFSPVGGWRTILPSCWLIMAYKNDSIDINDPRNVVIDEDGNTRFRKYSLRTSYSIALVDDPDMPYYQTTPARAVFFNNGETAYYRKYTNWDIVEDERDIVPNLRSGVNARVIRLADVYLMYAECLIQGSGNINEALVYINRVRHRSALQLLGPQGSGEFPMANHDGKAYDAQSLMHHLMTVERPLELSVEGNAIRHLDMRRWGITKQRFQDLSQRKYTSDNYTFINEDGESETRWGSVLKEVVTGENPIFNEYIQAADNYIENVHAYWPIPNSETVANPALNN